MTRTRTFRHPNSPKKKIEITPAFLTEVKALVNAGMTNKQLAEYYGVCEDTWYRYKSDNEELELIVRTGKMRTTAVVAGHLLKLCQQDNVPSIIFYLRTQGRWTEAKEPEDDTENKPIEKTVIKVTDPIEAAKIYEEFMLKT